jgi:hypothetical protein
MSKFLDLIKESTPNIEKYKEFGLDPAAGERLEGLYHTGLMKKFMDAYHELTNDIHKEEPFEIEDIIKFLAFKMDEFKPAATEVESIPAEDNQLQVDDAAVEQAQKALQAAKTITGVSNARGGVLGRDPEKNVERAVGKLYNKVAKRLKQFTKEF